MNTSLGRRFAVLGAGLGGLAMAGLLQQAGHAVEVYEQASAFLRVGAGIHLSPNLMKVLRRLGAEAMVLEHGDRPAFLINRRAEDGELISSLRLAGTMERRFGAPFLVINRADLHAALAATVDPTTIHLGKRLTDLVITPDSVRLAFADGTKAEADLVIGADGLHSMTRTALYGAERPQHLSVAGTPQSCGMG